MVKDDAEYAALTWLRGSVPGRILAEDLKERIAQVRATYEDNPANESTRKLLLKYRKSYQVLFVDDLEN